LHAFLSESQNSMLAATALVLDDDICDLR
jgi:hypothetical protein